MTSSRPTTISRAGREQPQRRGHETFPPTSHKSFYGTEAETSKHFPTQNREQERARQDPPPPPQHQMRTASRPDSFVPKAPPSPPSPPPVAGPSRLPAVVKQRTGVNRKSNQKTREPVTIVLSSSDEETPEREEQPMPNAQRSSSVASHGDRQSALPAVPSDQNSLTANNLRHYEMPRGADSSKRKRPSHSSSVTPQVNGPDEIEDFEDGHDYDVIHLPPPPLKSNVTKRARMQDKNGNSSVSQWYEWIILKPIVSHACTLGDRPISEEEGSRLARPCGRIQGRWTEPSHSRKWQGLIFGTARN
jgi:hypothetical protein